MIKLNCKGQSLVLFVLILPIILMIMIMVIDIGKMVNLRNQLDSINYLAIDYALDNIDNENLSLVIEELIKKNDLDINIAKISISNKIEVELEKDVDLILFGNKIIDVKSSYIGYSDNNKKIIERNN